MSKYTRMLTSEKESCQSLVFDFSQMNNLTSYYEGYSIPDQERMLVYAYSSRFTPLSLEGLGTIITDEAIYYHPNQNAGSCERIALDQLCHFLIFQEHPADVVHLLSAHSDRKIFGRTVAPNDTTGEELVIVLHHLQKKMMADSKQDRADYADTVGQTLDLIREDFHRYGVLTKRDLVLLDVISEDPAFLSETAFLRAENDYRLCDAASYQTDLASVSDALSKELFSQLQNPDTLFFLSYVEDLTSVGTFFLTQPLITAYAALKSLSTLTLRQGVILCCLCIRLGDSSLYDSLLAKIRDELDEDTFWKIQCFHARFSGERMSLVYDKMIRGKELSDAELDTTDSMGLTVLHYAIMLRDYELIRSLLRRKDWRKDSAQMKNSAIAEDPELAEVFSYVFLASMIWDDPELIGEIYAATSQTVYPLERSVRQMDLFISINEKLLEKEKKKLAEQNELRRSAASSGHLEMAYDISAGMRDVMTACADCTNRLEEYRSMKKELTDELWQMTKQKIQKTREFAAKVLDGGRSLAQYLLHIYMDTEMLYKNILDTTASWKLYRSGSLYFLTPADVSLDLSCFTWANGQIVQRFYHKDDAQAKRQGASFDGSRTFDNPSGQERRKKEKEKKRQEQKKRSSYRQKRYAYTDSAGGWFSASARTDLSLLKREYHILVKKYHPDNTDDPTSAEILREIMEERADILETMK